jgi:glyceraldehyde 3-phosphate dehydrogenase
MIGKKKIRVAVNGCGRIGRAFIRQAMNDKSIDIVAINDLGSLENISYLLKYDSVYGRAPFTVETAPEALVLDGKRVRFVSQSDPTLLPWKEEHIDVVVESTGFFTDYEKANAHIVAGARRVVISAPVKKESELGATVLMGINEEKLSTCSITSNASCTTNAASPVIAILDEVVGIEKAVLSTTHGYTASQSLVDGPSKKDIAEGRAAALNIVPTSTGAAIAVSQAYPKLLDKFDGISLRVPVPAGSIADITFISKRPTTVEEINNALIRGAHEKRFAGLFSVTDEPIVSSDIVGMHYASIAQLTMTRVVDGTLVKVLAWYDNEAGYTHSLVEHVKKAAYE